MSSKILLIEDDGLLRESLCDLLEEASYDVTQAANGEEALSATYNDRFDLYLIDINLPLIDGITLLEELRTAGDDTPAIFLTSHKEKEKLKEGFQSGGDDYITKPFDTDELLMRIEALLRRTKPAQSRQIGPFTILEEQMQILYNDTPLELSKKEYFLLRLFLYNLDTVLPKEHIIETVWGFGQIGSEGALRVYVNRLKQNVPDISIENIRAIGYKLVLQR